MKKAVEFLKKIKKDDNVIIIFHSDADGICSAAMIKKILPCEPLLINQPMPVEPNIITKIQTTVPDEIIFLDLAVAQQQNILKKIGNLCKILIIDHHISKDVSNKLITHINPRFDKHDIYQSTSYITYKICSKIKDISEMLWIAGVGIVGDYNIRFSTDVVADIEKYYNIHHIQESFIKNVADMIEASRATKVLSPEEIVNIFCKYPTYEEFKKTEAYNKLLKSYQLIQNEMDAILIDKVEKNGNIIFYNLRSKYNIRSPVATRLGEIYPKKLIVVYQFVGNKVKISMRAQNFFDVNDILKKATSSFNVSSGGHKEAGGVILRKEKWEEFKENLIKLVNEKHL
jgi:single-stranded DNA-specific DHH superfamily exonuclease